MKSNYYGNRGFTLIELMVTIAIIGIISAVSIGGYLSYRPGQVFRGAVSQVQNDLTRAKMRAVETRRQTRIIFSTTGYQFEDGNRAMNSDQWGNIDNDGVFTAGTPFRTENFDEYPQITLRDGVGNVILAGSEPIIGFSPRGTANNGSITVNHPKQGNAGIAVNIVGRVGVDLP